jgi:hypothetical protein
MHRCLMLVIAAAGLLLPLALQAQAPAILATCKDGSAFSGTTRSGACRGHGGVQSWDTTASPTPAPTAGPATSPASRPTAAPATRGTSSAGQVWVNTASKVYHCPGDRWYGKTKAGEYMSEAQAKTSGFRPDHNKACSS